MNWGKAIRQLESEWKDVPLGLRLTGAIEISVPAGGFVRNEVQRLLLTFGRSKTVRPLPLAMLIRIEGADV